MQQVKGGKQLIVTGTPVFDEKNEILLVVTNVRDITKLNTLRDQLEDSKRINCRFYQTLQEHDGIEHVLQEMVVKSQAMIQVVKKAIKVANSETSVLLLGESGVGKSMLARIIHQMSPRKNDPFVKHHKPWQAAINQMLKMGVRVAQQAFAKHGLDFVVNEYLPAKLGNTKKFLP